MKDVILTARNVSKQHDGQDLIKEVSFSIRRGSMVGIIGPNGAGKTTLLKILLGFDNAYTGEVIVEPNERVAYIPQLQTHDQFALPLSVYEFLCIGVNRLYTPDVERTRALMVDGLVHVGLTEEYLLQNVHSLSGGERQRLYIARALLGKPTLLVMDEPLASVDYHARGTLYTLLKHLNKEHGISMLLVSHDVESVVEISDTVLCLNTSLHLGCHPVEFMKNGGVPTDHVRAVEHHC